MTTIDAAQIVLAKRCEGAPEPEDFRLEPFTISEPGENELLIEIHFLSLDPYLRSKISGRHMSGGVMPGERMAGETVGKVLRSGSEKFQCGDIVRAQTGWCSHAIIDATLANRVDLDGLPTSLALGALGMPGLAAYAGIERLSEIKPGETFLVAAASGPVGSMAAQIARMKGARTVAVAGSDEKCNWCLEAAQFDACINYKKEALRDGIARACPDGIDVYFDNIGGDVLQAAVENLAISGRVILCGVAAEYNSNTRLPGPRPGLLIVKRATMKGLVVYDHEDLRSEMERKCGDWIRAGSVAFKEDVENGLENAPAAFARLTRGQNFGKSIVRLAKAPNS